MVKWTQRVPRSGIVVGCLAVATVSICLITLSSVEHRSQLDGVGHLYGRAPGSRTLLGSKEDAAQRIADAKAQFPRYDLVNMKSAPSDFDPNDMSYIFGVALYAAVCIVIAVFSLLFGLLWCSSRCCCNCCGGRKPAVGCCCPGKNGETRIYTTCEKWWVRIGMWISIAAVVSMCIMGYVGNGDFTVGVDGFVGAVVDTITDVINRVTTVIGQFQQVATLAGIADTASASLQDLKKAFEDVKKSVSDFRASVRDYNGYREQALNGVFAWCIFFTLFGLLGSIGCGGWPEVILIIFGFLTLLISWIMFGIHLPISIFIGDFCRAVHGYIVDRTACENENKARYKADRDDLLNCSASTVSKFGKTLNEVVKCAGTDQFATLDTSQWKMGGLILYGNDGQGNFKAGSSGSNPAMFTIRGLLKFCNYSTWDYVGKYRTDSLWTTRSATMYGKFANRTGYQDLSDTTVQTNLEKVISDCSAIIRVIEQQTGISLNIPIGNFTNYMKAFGVLFSLSDNIYDMTNCAYVFNAISSIEAKLCIDTLQSLDLIAAAFGVVSFMYFFLEFFAILGFKRFKWRTNTGTTEAGAQDKQLVSFVLR